MILRQNLAVAVFAALFLMACRSEALPPDPAVTLEFDPTSPAVAQGLSFEQWVSGLKVEAMSRGVSSAVFDRAFTGVRPNGEVLESDRSQPELTKTVWDYLDKAVSDTRVENGRRLLRENRALLAEIEREYGVDSQVIVAIWGMESAYGKHTGGHNVIQALATLAYGSRRATFFRTHLLAALEILQAGHVRAEDMQGSWAGAMGQTQFMPTAFARFATDEDGDGRRDIWGSLPDVFASTANFLSSFGWRHGEPWGMEVRLPEGFPWALADPFIKKPVEAWRLLGVRRIDGSPVPDSTGPAALFLPAGYRGPAFILYDNYRTLLHYNNSDAYALAVGILSDRVLGRGPVVGSWPRDEVPLDADQRLDLQATLTRAGYDTRGVDGIIGPNSRKALRAYQRDIGVPDDGFPTQHLLMRLKGLSAD
jgi:membrane-bound lytic murein transglycosylase B